MIRSSEPNLVASTSVVEKGSAARVQSSTSLSDCVISIRLSLSRSNTSIEVTELVAGSLVNEVQRVTLRVDAAANASGTFRLEVGDALGAREGRSRVSADNDGRYWTSQLGINSSAVEVRLCVCSRCFYFARPPAARRLTVFALLPL